MFGRRGEPRDPRPPCDPAPRATLDGGTGWRPFVGCPAPSVVRRLTGGDATSGGHRRGVPQLLDLLAAGSSAGLAAPLALRRATDGLAGPLADEVRATVRAVDLGARWRDELDALADRLDLPDLRRAVAAHPHRVARCLVGPGHLGACGIGATGTAGGHLRRPYRSGEMLFPLVFLVLPAFLLLTVVPVLLTTVRSIG